MHQVVLETRHRGLDLAYTICKVYYRAKPSRTIKQYKKIKIKIKITGYEKEIISYRRVISASD